MELAHAGQSEVDISIIDDDEAVRDALTVVFELEGFNVMAYSSGDEFVTLGGEDTKSCVILDVHMPGRSGIDLLQELEDDDYPAPIFIISGQGNIPTAVKAIKKGAYDFIEKPFDAETVVRQVRDAVTTYSRTAGAGRSDRKPLFPGHERLTPREIEVLTEVTSGASNKEAGRRLGISPRTIEVHRARIMEKLGARNAADLVRIVLGGE